MKLAIYSAPISIFAAGILSSTIVVANNLPPGMGPRGSIPWDYNDNAKQLWGGDWNKYRAAHPYDEDCSISESDNWKGAGQCSQSWECRGARLCERGGWCSGYDGCEGTPLQDDAPGLPPIQ
jgi:hypothetical protein